MSNLVVPVTEEFSSVFLSAYPKHLEGSEVNYNISTLNIYSEGGSDVGSFDFDRIALSSSSEYSRKPGDSQPELLNNIKFEADDTPNDKLRQSVTNSTGSPDGKVDDDHNFTLPEILINDEQEEINLSNRESTEMQVMPKFGYKIDSDREIQEKKNNHIAQEYGEKTVSQVVFIENEESGKEKYKNEIRNSLTVLAKKQKKKKRSEGQQSSCNKCVVI